MHEKNNHALFKCYRPICPNRLHLFCRRGGGGGGAEAKTIALTLTIGGHDYTAIISGTAATVFLPQGSAIPTAATLPAAGVHLDTCLTGEYPADDGDGVLVYPMAADGTPGKPAGAVSGRRIWFADKAENPLKSAVHAYT